MVSIIKYADSMGFPVKFPINLQNPQMIIQTKSPYLCPHAEKKNMVLSFQCFFSDPPKALVLSRLDPVQRPSPENRWTEVSFQKEIRNYSIICS